jgi:AcrR family transcriptional regulator
MTRAASAPSRSPGETAGLSRERVCKEALALVDEEGLEALTMRRLGARLGVEAMSLYRHVRNKADLLDALHVAVLGDIQPAPPAKRAHEPAWRVVLGGLARSLRLSLLRHPHVVSLLATRPVSAPEVLATVAQVSRLLVDAGFSDYAAQTAVVEVGVFTVGHTLSETQGRPPTLVGAPPLPGGAEFEFALEALLDGLGRHAGAARRPRKRGPQP